MVLMYQLKTLVFLAPWVRQGKRFLVCYEKLSCFYLTFIVHKGCQSNTKENEHHIWVIRIYWTFIAEWVVFHIVFPFDPSVDSLQKFTSFLALVPFQPLSLRMWEHMGSYPRLGQGSGFAWGQTDPVLGCLASLSTQETKAPYIWQSGLGVIIYSSPNSEDD